MSNLNQYDEINRLYVHAESLISQYQHKAAEACIPAINELRYAGRHTLNSLFPSGRDTSLDPDEVLYVEGQIHKAERHCKRAAYDAVAATLTFCGLKLATFQDRYGHHPRVIAEAIPDYNEQIKRIYSAQEITKDVMENDSKKGEFYTDLAELLPCILEFTNDLNILHIPRIEQLLDSDAKERKENLDARLAAEQSATAANEIAMFAVAAAVIIPLLIWYFS